MALIKCKECANEVSDKAKSCPNCGAPIDPPIASDEQSTLHPQNYNDAVGAFNHKFYNFIRSIFRKKEKESENADTTELSEAEKSNSFFSYDKIIIGIIILIVLIKLFLAVID